MKVVIVVLSWNSKKYIGECLNSLKKTKTEIILVDGGSTDGSPKYLKTNYPEFKLIETNKTRFINGWQSIEQRWFNQELSVSRGFW